MSNKFPVLAFLFVSISAQAVEVRCPQIETRMVGASGWALTGPSQLGMGVTQFAAVDARTVGGYAFPRCSARVQGNPMSFEFGQQLYTSCYVRTNLRDNSQNSFECALAAQAAAPRTPATITGPSRDAGVAPAAAARP